MPYVAAAAFTPSELPAALSEAGFQIRHGYDGQKTGFWWSREVSSTYNDVGETCDTEADAIASAERSLESL